MHTTVRAFLVSWQEACFEMNNNGWQNLPAVSWPKATQIFMHLYNALVHRRERSARTLQTLDTVIETWLEKQTLHYTLCWCRGCDWECNRSLRPP